MANEISTTGGASLVIGGVSVNVQQGKPTKYAVGKNTDESGKVTFTFGKRPVPLEREALIGAAKGMSAMRVIQSKKMGAGTASNNVIMSGADAAQVLEKLIDAE